MRATIGYQVSGAAGALLMALLAVGCGESADQAPGGGSGAAQDAGTGEGGPTGSGGAGSTGLGEAGAPPALPENATVTDAGAVIIEEHTTSNYDEFSPSCEEQQCTSDERCLDGPKGTYCVHPCPGQPCPHPRSRNRGR